MTAVTSSSACGVATVCIFGDVVWRVKEGGGVMYGLCVSILWCCVLFLVLCIVTYVSASFKFLKLLNFAPL